MQIVRADQREPFITLDGSEIRELAGVPSGNSANQSLAQATVPPGAEHELRNDGAQPLVLLCCCSPPYSHEDTVIVANRAVPGPAEPIDPARLAD